MTTNDNLRALDADVVQDLNDSIKAARYDWLSRGGWEVMLNPIMWPERLNFHEAIAAGMMQVAIDAAQEGDKP